MRQGVLTGASAISMSGQMGVAGPMSMSLGVFIGIWMVMMVAMMVPSVLPAVRVFDARARAADRLHGATALFVVGYLLVWGATGGAAYVIVQALQAWLPIGNPAAIRVGALLLIVAGIYQLTPLKVACLRHCQMPGKEVALREIAPVRGSLSSLRAGLVHGVYCLGSSWALMLVLLLLGMMNLAWMAAVAAVIFIEKVVPSGDVASKIVGWGLVGCGIILLAAPHTLPALGGG
jgi:predicted metal-binding membrane protein